MNMASEPLGRGADNIVDLARKTVVTDILKTPVVTQCWPVWRPLILDSLGLAPTAGHFLELGSQLSEIFRSTAQAGRGQDSLSAGGAAWESLVCYYLNLCLIGSNAVVFKKRTAVPPSIQDALTISYRNVSANTESDMVAVTFPDNDVALLEPLAKGESIKERLDVIAQRSFPDLAVAIVQCKTNWNDNAQIPMMWDMLYNAKIFYDPRINQGRNNRHLINFKSFNYAFVTVPTNKLESFKPNSLSVKRVSELSGGNYWGRPDQPGIARSIRQIFDVAKIGPSSGRGVLPSLARFLPLLPSRYSYFQLSDSPDVPVPLEELGNSPQQSLAL
ncbi:hypothetical protein NX774_21380 [Massilia agilis]|uniref:Uncharacterized protein n=1 Tax=Massilia agilis TaxID=1811226 RepID=A0ABT2DGM7_9BURK|nr:hypothetical protein [Massilia agilis]MCS0810480.1 hypothetical protein [Massilia agilis]